VVRHAAEVTERPLGRADFALLLGQLVRKRYEELAVAFALVRRDHEDAGQVVRVFALFFLRKVAHNVVSILVVLAHDVEQERVDVVIPEN
jgi:hypothetical protein